MQAFVGTSLGRVVSASSMRSIREDKSGESI
jgi:hypothetical protein